MNDSNHPPIPSPFEPLRPATVSVLQGPRVWKDAPQIVKSVRLLTLLAVCGLPLLIGFSFMSEKDIAEKIVLSGFFCVLWVFQIYMLFALKNGAKPAWIIQIIISCLGLTGFPVGTLIHAYILSHWFKPETKAWFGKS